MRKVLISFFTLLIAAMPAFCDIFQGGVAKHGLKDNNRIVDSKTKAPISQAKVTIPQNDYDTYTDNDGKFSIDTDIKGPTVMSVEKAGYKPFSVTIDEKSSSHPIIMGIEKSTPKDITLDTDMIHLGDNNYSNDSANAKDFKVKAVGPFYSKDFKLPNGGDVARTELVIGSIIGVDTAMAKAMKQNRVAKAFASPPEVYFNGSKIAEIQVNGDGQKIKIPSNLIRQGQENQVTIKTGRNLMQTAYTDYDDIELMNLSIETY